MNIKNRPIRFVSLLLVPCLLMGCTGYNRYAVVLPKDGALPVEKTVVILHQGRDTCYLMDVRLINWCLEATAQRVPAGFRPKKDQVLHVYLDPSVQILEFGMRESLPATVSIPYEAIENVEYFEVSTGKSIGYTAIAVAAVLGGVVLILFLGLLVAMAHAGCPYIYGFNGENYEFAGEIFSGTAYTAAECDDYLVLPNLKAVNNEYRLNIVNEEPAAEYIDVAELLVVDHPIGTEVLVDKYGVPHALSGLCSPTAAVALSGEDVRDAVIRSDGLPYVGHVYEEANRDIDGVVLTFERPRGASAATLVVQGKNCPWLNYVYNEFCQSFGSAYGAWYEGRKIATAGGLDPWLLDQGVPLSVYIEEGGAWRFVDYYPAVGVAAVKKGVLPLELPATASDEVRVKLEFGSLFWEIDYVGIDFSPDTLVQTRRVPLASAVDESGRDVITLLNADDGRYYEQRELGAYALLKFAAPEPTAGLTRTAFLYGQGYSAIPRDPRNQPDLELLHSWEEPGRLIEFSKELFVDTYKPLSRIEY